MLFTLLDGVPVLSASGTARPWVVTAVGKVDEDEDCSTGPMSWWIRPKTCVGAAVMWIPFQVEP